MAITDTQKVDYLFKKVGYGVTKTDTVLHKLAPNESNPSPYLEVIKYGQKQEIYHLLLTVDTDPW